MAMPPPLAVGIAAAAADSCSWCHTLSVKSSKRFARAVLGWDPDERDLPGMHAATLNCAMLPVRQIRVPDLPDRAGEAPGCEKIRFLIAGGYFQVLAVATRQ